MKLCELMKFMTGLCLSKKPYLLVSAISSVSFGAIMEKIISKLAFEDSIMPLFILAIVALLSVIFIISDFITGIIASRSKGEKIQSGKWGVTTGKFFGLVLYLCLASLLLAVIPGSYIVFTIVFFPLILTILKEFISVGENIEKMYNKKPYIFTAIDRLFDILEMKFFKSLENKNIFKEKDKQ